MCTIDLTVLKGDRNEWNEIQKYRIQGYEGWTRQCIKNEMEWNMGNKILMKEWMNVKEE